MSKLFLPFGVYISWILNSFLNLLDEISITYTIQWMVSKWSEICKFANSVFSVTKAVLYKCFPF